VASKTVKSSALPWFITSRVKAPKREGLTEIEQACLALEVDGMPCPLDVNQEQWVRSSFSYVCAKYMEKYPKAYKKKERIRIVPPKLKKSGFSKSKSIKQRQVKVEGVDVTSKEFLETFAWRKVRMEALVRYGPVCQCCGASPQTGAVMNVDHIKPRKLFPDLALDVNNLQILCHDCNHGKGNWDQTDWRNLPKGEAQ